ncbi:hypothetical protein DERF_013289 [Dermatophagoides farinae]|uniref:Uncharacterized protein n=1 Tax=Dermatophagoides farinae TaxID=6954 RepID=A0A922HLT7_DERFA|nr:hypothetical protein DERF_013289 [Dermatophagoides farinae]
MQQNMDMDDEDEPKKKWSVNGVIGDKRTLLLFL